MQEISKSLRQRLGARPQPQMHPEPDVLNAYAERLLPAAERAEVVLHLAECGYCREVVSVSLAQFELEPAARGASLRARLWVPAFRFGAALAVLAVTATLVIEKPWRTGTAAPVQSSHDSQVHQPQSPVTNAQMTPASQPAIGTEQDSMRAAVSTDRPPSTESRMRPDSAVRGPATVENGRARESAPVATDAGAVGGAQLAPPVPTESAATHAVLTPQARATINRPQPTGSQRDYVNTNLLQGNATDANALPAAPSPQGPSTSCAYAGTLPPLSLNEAISHADNPNVVPPKTSGAASTGSGTTFSGSRFFAAPRKIEKYVAKDLKKAGSVAGSTAGTVAEAFGGRSSFVGNAVASSAADVGDNDYRQEAHPQFRLNDGTLMRSTDATQWHEAYPQTSNLQLKVLVTKGDQVWAGGNNATIIHSWNSGVNWETLKVPDSGDITAITVDNGWQVKTSNGQTFVSEDNGKTWVPLEQGK